MIHVLLVDDHAVVRAGLRLLLESQADIRVVAEVGTGTEADAAVRTFSPDVVLLDLDLGPGPDGVEITRTIRGHQNPPQVLIFTTFDADADIVRTIEAGAIGYLMKTAHPEEIFRAVRAAVRGETTLSPPVATVLLQQVQRPHTALTPREADIITLLGEGLSNRDLSRRLLISEATVKTHLAHVYEKLGATSRGSAVAIATQRGLIRGRSTPNEPGSST